jgi:hypothetical protein
MRESSETFASLFGAWRRFPSGERGQLVPVLAMTLAFVFAAAATQRRVI